MTDTAHETRREDAADTPVVNSWNEWDPLEEVVVGVLDGSSILPWEPAIEAVTAVEYVDRSREYHESYGGKALPPIYKQEAQRELDEFVSILEGEGVTVRRPEPIDQARPYATPDWEAAGGNCQANPRDVLIVLGNEILEAPMSWRSRYFEFLSYRALCKEYFDRGAKWRAAPKPSMSDEAYDPYYERGKGWFTTEFEPLFDAADMSRFGHDIFIQRSHVTNQFGIKWLQAHYGDTFDFHHVEFDDYRAVHIDATFVPLRPGIALINPDRPMTVVPDILRSSDWDLVESPRSSMPQSDPGYYSYRWLTMNMLNIDETKILVEASETAMMEFLSAHGFEPVPCPFRNNYRFGGSMHCATVDIRRRGGLQSYF